MQMSFSKFKRTELRVCGGEKNICDNHAEETINEDLLKNFDDADLF